MKRFRILHIVLFLWIAIGVLFSLSKLENLVHLDSLDYLESQSSDTLDTFVPITSAEPVEGSTTDSTFASFFAALRQAKTQAVRVVHFGDSQIEQDRITMTLRRHWQQQYGGCGLGLIPVLQTVPTYTLAQSLSMNGSEVSSGNGPRRYFVYGLRSLRREKNNRYGVMGQVLVMNDSLVSGSEHLMLTLHPYAYRDRQFARLRLWADSSITLTQADSIVYLDGKGDVYGLSMESETGVYVDNIPMRGCSGTIFTNISEEQLTEYFRETNTRLIIMQYGGNALPNVEEHKNISKTVRQLGQQIRYLRRCAPEATILFIGPSDMLINDHGTMVSNPMVPYMDHQLQLLAKREGIAYWSLYQVMGGEGSMVQWQEQGLAGDDGVHFTKKGADLVAAELINFINSQLTN